MATANQVSQLFVALYNRAIDGVTAQQYSGRAYNQSFISEVIGLTPNLRTMTNQEFVELVYKNALGKDNNSDKAGIDYWVSQANDNNWRREQLTDNLLRSINAWADQNADTTGLNADQITLASQGATVFRTKVAIAEQAATTVGGQADNYALTFGSGLEEVTILNYNTTRENNTKILQGIAARNPLAQSGGATLALGVNPDTGEGQESFLPTDPNPPASGASKYVASTKFDDIVTGTVALTDPTFTADTQIDAGTGNDTLKLNMSTSFTGLSGDGKVSNIERIELTNTTVNDNVTFNASGIRDVYTYVLNGANGINLTNIAYNEYLLIEMNNIKSTGNTTGSSGASTATNGGVTQITFDTTPTGGRLDLNFNGVGYDSTDNRISNHDILFGIGSGSAIDPNGSADDFANQAAGIGILNIALTGNNYADIVNTGVNRITVGGNGSLTTNLSRGVTYFNGANATGSLNITATDKKETGENGTNIFEYFATGSAADKVSIAVERLGQNATVNLGLGDDTLTLSGEVDHEARKQFYNFNTIENLVFQDLTGDALLIDLGTTIVTTPQDPITSGSGSKKTEIPQEPIVTTTQDRSANLQTLTFEDGASVQLTSLGKKDLKVTYNGATDTQKILVDTEGTVDLVLQGSDAGTAGTGKMGAGFVNLSNAKTVNVDLTGQGFEGYLSAGNAVDLNITNYTGDKKLKFKANTLTEKNDLSSVVNLTIDTEAQDINPSHLASSIYSVDLSAVGFASLANVTLKGIGDIVFGDINTSPTSSISFNGKAYSGHLHTGNLYAGDNAIQITTKGAITTGNLAASHIEIDLSKNITTIDGQYNNNIGAIILTPNLKNEVATLNYTTGISGTRGHQTDTQQIHVHANRANMILNGAGGVDKFHITASSFTKEIVLSGHLGSSRDNQSDFVFIDLRKTSGAIVDMHNLVVNNSNNGIHITASKGQDNISLLANQNHDIISFNAGGPATAQAEKYSLNLAGTTLEKFQSFTLEGLTLTSLYVDGRIEAQELTNALYTHITQGEEAFKQTQSSILKDQTTNTYYTYEELFNTQGSFTGLNNKQGWEYNPQLIEKTDTTTIKITSSEKSDVPDLKLNWEGNENTHAAFDYYDEENSNKQKAWHHVNSANAKLVDTTGATLTGTQTINNIIGMAKNKTITTNEVGYRGGYAYGNNLYFVDLGTSTNNSASKAMKGVTIASVDIIDNEGITYTFAAIGNEGYSSYASQYYPTKTGGFTVRFYASYLPFNSFTSNLKNLLEGQPINTSHSVDFVVWKDGVKTDIKDSLVGKKFLDAVTFTNPTNNSLQFSLTSPKYEITNPSFKPDDLDRTYQTESIKIGNTTVKLEEYHPVEHIDPIPAKITIDFKEGLKIGEYYQFAGKYVFATENLSGEEIAKAFKGEDVSGAIVLGEWYQELGSAGTMVAGIDSVNVDFSVNDSTLTLVDKQSGTPLNNGIPLGIKGMETNAQFMNALKVTGGANPPKVTIKTTTKQGQDEATIHADSYVNLTLSVAGDSHTKTEFAKSIDELGTLSSISNFELGIDKLSLYQFADDVQIEYQGELFEAANLASQNDLNIQDNVYIDTFGTTLQAQINAQGLITFSHESNIESKVYLLKNIATNKLAGFAHDEDFYVLASGNNPNATTDDLLIKLTGIGSMVFDVSTLLG